MKGLVLNKPLAYAVHERSYGEPIETPWDAVLPHLGPKITKSYGWKMLANQRDFYQQIEHHDILQVSRTGTGKTETTVFKAFEQALRQKQNGEAKEEEAWRPVIYLYPNNALLFDQEERMREHNGALAGGDIGIVRYSSDMTRKERRRIRELAGKEKIDILLMTVDMYKDTLYSAIKRGETGWGEALIGPQMVVCDELDYYPAYSLAYLLALYRIFKRYNQEHNREVRFVFNSATIPNAEEVAREALLDAKVVTGKAKHGRIQIFAYSQGTGLYDKARGELTTFDLFLQKLLEGEIYPTAQVMIYADNKFLLERVAIVEELLQRQFGLVHGGLTRREVRETIKLFRRKELRGLLVTRAVEAGVNFGDLDLVVILGYPSGGKRGVHQVVMRVALEPERDGQVFWFLAPRQPLETYYVMNPGRLQALIETLEPEPLRYQFFSEKILKMAILLCGALELTERKFQWVFPHSLESYLEAKVEKLLTDLVADGKARKGRHRFAIHPERSEEEYFAQRFRTTLKELPVVTQTNQVVGYLDVERAARQGQEGDYLILGGEVWQVTQGEDHRIVVDQADHAWYTENTPFKQVRKGRGTSRVVKGRVKVWFGEVEVTFIPKRRRIYELGSCRLIKELGRPTKKAGIRYWTEGTIMEFRGARLGRDELTHLGAALMRAIQNCLGIDSSGLEIQRLTRGMTRQHLVVLDRGAPTGSSKRVFDQVGVVLAEIRKNLIGCACRRVCEACVDLTAYRGAYSRKAHDHLRFILTQLGR